ncbi:hypothetical protein Dimus_028360 [Dionaea muscipula]
MATFSSSMVIAFLLLLRCSLNHSSSSSSAVRRRLLHQPFLLPQSFPPTPPPDSSPAVVDPLHNHQQPKHPVTSTAANPFFPSNPLRLPPPPPPASATRYVPTFPANITSLPLHRSSSSSDHSPHVSHNLIAVIVLLSLLAASLLISLSFVVHRRRRRSIATPKPEHEIFGLHPPDSANYGDYHYHHLPKFCTSAAASNSNTEFLYLGTLAKSCEFELKKVANHDGAQLGESSSQYQELGSPELRPLSPLPRMQSFEQNPQNSSDVDDDEDEEDEEFFSPRGSSGRMPSSSSSRPMELENLEILDSDTSSSPPSSPSPLLNSSFRSHKSDMAAAFSHSPPTVRDPSDGLSDSPPNQLPMAESENVSGKSPTKPPPLPPPLPARSGEVFVSGVGPPPFVRPSWKPKSKAFHWNRLRVSSNRGTMWDRLEPPSSQANEETAQTLFAAIDSSPPSNTNLQSSIKENKGFDAEKSQNIAILNVTVEEVCDALVEGNLDMLGSELLEILLKMAPTEEEEEEEEETKIKELYQDDCRPSRNLGPAEKLLKALLDIPFAFKRVEAMLYLVNFEPEIEYLTKSFETLEAACEELRGSRMFVKLVEAVLKTAGNCMNIETTNWGNAHKFELNTLLKLIDIKGHDGKTTVLHFVVQEMINDAEGSYVLQRKYLKNAEIDDSQQLDLQDDDIDCRMRSGLEVVASLNRELTNVKKAACIDFNVLCNELQKLASEITIVKEVMDLNDQINQQGDEGGSRSFNEAMERFLKKAEVEIIAIQSREDRALTNVKELAAYFPWSSFNEEEEEEKAHPLRVFVAVRDFLCILHRVCEEAAEMNERSIIHQLG